MTKQSQSYEKYYNSKNIENAVEEIQIHVSASIPKNKSSTDIFFYRPQWRDEEQQDWRNFKAQKVRNVWQKKLGWKYDELIARTQK